MSCRQKTDDGRLTRDQRRWMTYQGQTRTEANSLLLAVISQLSELIVRIHKSKIIVFKLINFLYEECLRLPSTSLSPIDQAAGYKY